MSDDRVPVTILTGFYGAGKTTLLNRLVAAPEAGRVVVIVNEAGEVALDGRLIVSRTERPEIVELREGCVCCTVRGDLSRAVGQLLDRRTSWFRRLQFDRILVECSGLASPGPVVQTFVLDSRLAAETRVDGVVAMASALDLPRQLAEHPEAADQIAYADRVVLNHCDRAGDAVPATLAALRALNPSVTVDLATRADVPVPPLLDLRADDPSRWHVSKVTTSVFIHAGGVRHVVVRADAALDVQKVKMFLQFVAARRTWTLMRCKGILRCDGLSRAVVAHGIYQWLEFGPSELDPPLVSELLLIGRGLDDGEIGRAWAAVVGN